jgi:hypothetical protein
MMDQHCACVVEPPPPAVVVARGARVVVSVGALSQKKNSAFQAHCPMHCVESMMDQHCNCVVVTPPPPVVLVTGPRVVVSPVATGASSQNEKAAFHAHRPMH